MRFIAWNIRAGGGRRVAAIARQIEAWDADVVALSEFRATAPSATLALLLADAGLVYQRSTAGAALPAKNEILVASRWPLRPIRLSTTAPGDGRWLPLRVDGPRPVNLLAIHFPLGAIRYTSYMTAAL